MHHFIKTDRQADLTNGIKATKMQQDAPCLRFAGRLAQPGQYNGAHVIAWREQLVQLFAMCGVQFIRQSLVEQARATRQCFRA